MEGGVKMSKKTSKIPGGRRVTATNKYDRTNSASDVDISRGKVTSIVEHGRDGSSHSHEVISSIFGFSKGDREKDKE